MALCLIHRTSHPFKAFIEVSATPGSKVTATLGDKVFSGTAGTNGKVTITVKKKGTYTVTSDATNTQSTTVAALKARETYPTNITGKFTLTITNQSINKKESAVITVNRKSSNYGGGGTGALKTGAAIYYGDVLTISVTNKNADAYTAPTLKVNNNDHESGKDFTVQNANVTAVTTNDVNSYKLTITNAIIAKTKKTAATVTVHKTSSNYKGVDADKDLATNATIYYGDVLTITATNQDTDAYNNPTLKVNNNNHTSGSTHTVKAAVSAVASATVKSWTLGVTQGTGSTLVVKRTASAYQGADNGDLANKSTVYYGDKIEKKSGDVITGFDTYKITTSGMSGTGPWTVTGGTVSLTSSATPTQYKLTKNLNNNYAVKVMRTAMSTAGNAAGAKKDIEIGNNGVIYYGDTLSFTPTASTDYQGNYSTSGLSSNISEQNSAKTGTVAGNVTVTSTASVIPASMTDMTDLWTGYDLGYGMGAYSANSGNSEVGDIGTYGKINAVAKAWDNTLWVDEWTYETKESGTLIDVTGYAAKVSAHKVSLTGKSKVTLKFKVNYANSTARLVILCHTEKPDYYNWTANAGYIFSEHYEDLWTPPDNMDYERAWITLGRTTTKAPEKGYYSNRNDIGLNTSGGQTVTMTRPFSGFNGDYYIMVLLYLSQDGCEVTLQSISFT